MVTGKVVVFGLLLIFVVPGAVGIPAGFQAPCPKMCPYNLELVCGSDGITYPNRCVLSVARCANPDILFAYDGPCRPPTEDPAVGNPGFQPSCLDPMCPRIYKPVCGSDGITYANECLLYLAGCANPDILIASEGPCNPPTYDQPTDVPSTDDPPTDVPSTDDPPRK